MVTFSYNDAYLILNPNVLKLLIDWLKSTVDFPIDLVVHLMVDDMNFRSRHERFCFMDHSFNTFFKTFKSPHTNIASN